MVLFLCRNKSSRNGTNLCEDFFISIIRISGAKTRQRGAPGWAQPTRARPPLLACQVGCTHLVAPLMTPWYYKITYFQKKLGRKNYCDPGDRAATKPCSSSRGQICSSFGAPERGVFVLHHHQPFSIANFMMLPTGSKWEGCMSQNIIYLYFKNLSSGTSANHYFPLRKDYLFSFMMCRHLLKQALETERAQMSCFMHCV